MPNPDPGKERSQITNILGKPLRMQLALEQVPTASKSPTRELLLAWLEHMCFPYPESKEPQELGVSLKADLSSLSWKVIHESTGLVYRLNGLMKQNGLPEKEISLLEEIAEDLGDNKMGAWLTVHNQGQDAGWFFEGPIPLLDVLLHVPPGPARKTLGQWAAKNALTHCSLFGRSAGGGNPFHELRFVLPGDGVEQQMLTALDLFDQYGVEIPPKAALAALLHPGRAKLAISVWLSPKGLVKIGILAPELPLNWLIALCRSMPGSNEKKLAEFQGTLGATDGPSWAEGFRQADGFGVNLHYYL